MSTLELVLQVAREGLLVALLVSAPVVLIATLVGLVVAFLQAATQLQEQTLAFGVRLVAVALALLALGPWMGAEIVRFTALVFERIPHVR